MVGIRRNQGWKLCSSFAHSLFALLVKITHFKERLWAIRSCRSFKKSNPEQIALIAFYKRATVSKLLLSLFTKERPWAKHSLKKSDVSDSLLVQANPKICPRANCYCCSLLYHSFLKSNGRSLQNSNHEQITFLLFRSQKSGDSLEKPKSKFLTLQKLQLYFLLQKSPFYIYKFSILFKNVYTAIKCNFG